MKQIYVTVEEFLANGGILNSQREIYDGINTDKRLIGTYAAIKKDNLHIEKDKIIIDRPDRKVLMNGVKVFVKLTQTTWSLNCTLVKIYCQPLYF